MTLVSKKTSFLRNKSKDEFIDTLKTYFNSKTLEAYIFGSFYSTQFNTDSDLDLLIVVDTDLKFHERFQLFPELCHFLQNENVPFDLIIYTPSEFEKLTTEGKNSKVGFWSNFVKSSKKII